MVVSKDICFQCPPASCHGPRSLSSNENVKVKSLDSRRMRHNSIAITMLGSSTLLSWISRGWWGGINNEQHRTWICPKFSCLLTVINNSRFDINKDLALLQSSPGTLARRLTHYIRRNSYLWTFDDPTRSLINEIFLRQTVTSYPVYPRTVYLQRLSLWYQFHFPLLWYHGRITDVDIEAHLEPNQALSSTWVNKKAPARHLRSFTCPRSIHLIEVDSRYVVEPWRALVWATSTEFPGI